MDYDCVLLPVHYGRYDCEENLDFGDGKSAFSESCDANGDVGEIFKRRDVSHTAGASWCTHAQDTKSEFVCFEK